ncbi:trypsin-like peptidase domain-containing protein [Dactylosporangium maewongense]|uniref:Trypsin-like peptidase domain-containing protein n=2 Tax=Dactylosporangium maewongense TaxID=634393 RepID=A0ABP4KYX7_9ACTN
MCKVDIMSDEDRQWSAPPTAPRPATPGQPPGADGSPGASDLPPSSGAPEPLASPPEPIWARPVGGEQRTGAPGQVPAGPFPPSVGQPAAGAHTTPLPGHPQPAAGAHTAPLPGHPQHAAPLPGHPQHAAPLPGHSQHAAPLPGHPQHTAPLQSHPAPGAQTWPAQQTGAFPAGGSPGIGSTTAAFPAVTAPGQQPHNGHPGYGSQPVSGYPVSGYPVSGHPASGQPAYGPQQPVRGGRVAGLIVAGVVIAVVSAFGGGLVATKFAGDSAEPTTVITRNAAPNLERGSVGAVAEAVLPSVVDITTGEGEGSGVIMSTDGTIITNNHVVAGATKLTVTFSTGKTATATVVGTDPAGDIAVIKAQNVSGLTAAKFGDSDALRVGDTVLAVGSPLGLQGSVTAGIVSALHRTISSGEQGAKSIADAIQTDAAINPGNSGGALVNLAGEVVGINTAILTAGENSNGNIGVGFAISANRARSAADQLAKGGKVSHPYLGVQLGDGDGGALIGGVVAAGPADKAGMKTGDIVTKIGSTQIKDATDLINAIQAAKAGDQLKMTVKRDGAEQQLTVTLGESP